MRMLRKTQEDKDPPSVKWQNKKDVRGTSHVLYDSGGQSGKFTKIQNKKL